MVMTWYHINSQIPLKKLALIKKKEIPLAYSIRNGLTLAYN